MKDACAEVGAVAKPTQAVDANTLGVRMEQPTQIKIDKAATE